MINCLHHDPLPPRCLLSTRRVSYSSNAIAVTISRTPGAARTQARLSAFALALWCRETRRKRHHFVLTLDLLQTLLVLVMPNVFTTYDMETLAQSLKKLGLRASLGLQMPPGDLRLECVDLSALEQLSHPIEHTAFKALGIQFHQFDAEAP